MSERADKKGGMVEPQEKPDKKDWMGRPAREAPHHKRKTEKAG